MGSYIDSVLTGGESVIYRGNLSLWAMLGSIILGVLLLLMGLALLIGTVAVGGGNVYAFALIIFSAFPLLAVYIKYKTTELAITNKRIFAKFGFISRNTIEMNINKVESIQVDQTILGRICNYGSLVISGAGNPQTPVPGIADPMKFRREFIEAQDKVQHK